MDPRSGEILKANIVFTLGWLEGWLGKRLFFGPAFTNSTAKVKATDTVHLRALAAGGRADGGISDGKRRSGQWPDAPGLPEDLRLRVLDSGVCSSGSDAGSYQFVHRHPHESVMCLALHDSGPHVFHLRRTGATEDEVHQFLSAGVAQVTSHEVGHTLGLRNNFRGSTSVPYEQTQNRSFVLENGLSASTMDSIPTNLMSSAERDELKASIFGGKDLGEPVFFSPVVGAYDRWVIRYGYMPLSNENSAECSKRLWCPMGDELAAIAQEYDSASFTFASDETVDSFDPYTVRHDLTSDPIR